MSCFDNKNLPPGDPDLKNCLGDAYECWITIRDAALNAGQYNTSEWNFGGNKFGWNLRIRDRKRVVIYLTPQLNYMMIAFVLGEAASKEALSADIADEIKYEINSARVYAEGRGFRLRVAPALVKDILELIRIKSAH